MTMIDEGPVIAALRGAADDFAVSLDARDRIIDEARDLTNGGRTSRIRTVSRRHGRGRSLALAAAAGVVALAITVPLVRNEGRSTGGPGDAFGVTGRTVHGALEGPFLPLSQVSAASNALNPRGTASKAVLTGTGFLAGTSPTASSSLRIEEVGSIALSVRRGTFGSVVAKLSAVAIDDGGFVAATQVQIGGTRSGTASSGTVVLQVPQRAFAKLVDNVAQLGAATSVVTSTTDVTGQYVDLQARSTALQVSRLQYLKIMNRTNSIDGILAVQRQLDALQSQIEQFQAQITLLKTATTYGALTVSLTEAGHAATDVHPQSGINRAWHDGIGGFVAGFEWMIRIAGPLLFALVSLAALFAIGRTVRRARRRRGI